MRSIVRVLAPLLAALAVLAWGATALVGATARSWFERDLAARSRLAAGGINAALAPRTDLRQLGVALRDIVRTERIAAAQACDVDGRPLARTVAVPERLGCAALHRQVPAGAAERARWPGVDFSDVLDGRPVHVSVVPLSAGSTFLGTAVLFHDMDDVLGRERASRYVSVAAFVVMGLLASALTILVRRASWRSWTKELRALLAPGHGHRARPPGPFQPLLADVRQMVSDLAAENAVRWSPERLRRTLASALHGESVVVLANREPYVHERGPDGPRVVHPASGLVTALEPIMRACSGTWVAHGGGSADRETVDRHDRVRVPPGREAYALRRVWLGEEEERGYYYGFANEGLWPLCHIAHARPTFRAEDFRHYQRVNERFAVAACEEAGGPEPIVLVQDYHLALAPRLIRERLPRATVIGFWHIPWPNAEQFGICPWARELLTGLLGGAVIGFHTQLHCNNFLESVDRYLEARIDRERQAVVLNGHECLVRSYPISIEWPNRWVEGAPPVGDCRESVLAELDLDADALLGVGVDRLDYTKGIEERFLAVERLLERFPQLRGRFTFAQLAAPSRTLIPRYRALAESVEALASRINQRFERGGWRPIRLARSHHEPAEIFRYLRAADVCYVSSLHDGMNLVAKEFVAARDDERGVLVLSRFTGAARELPEALLVNPYDLEEASEALAYAVQMSPREQADRMRAMRAFVAEFNVYRWAGRMLGDAARVRQHGRLTLRLSMGLRRAGAAGA